MIRNILLATLFFFGPALLMFMLRNIVILLRLWLLRRRQRAMEPEIIDISPVEKGTVPRWFYILAVLLGLASAVAGFVYLQSAETEPRHYVPAHIGDDGKIVPGHWQERRP